MISHRFALAAVTALVAVSAIAQPAPRVVSNSVADVSADGRTIAFVSDRDSISYAYLIGVDGTAERRLSSRPTGRVRFALDGGRVYMSGTGADSGRVFAMKLDGTAVQSVAEVSGRNPVLSPDAKSVAYLSGPWTSTATMVSRADGSHARVIAGGSTTAWNAAWSPDGKRIAYTYGTKGAPLQVHIVNADGTGDSAITAMTAEDGSAQMPAWSRDGSMLAIQVDNGKTHTSHIWVVTLRTRKAVKLAPHEGYGDEVPAWFPDGKRLAFQSNRTGRMDIWVMNVDGTGARQVTGLR